MDRKTIIILLVCFGLVLTLRPLSQKLFPDIPLPAQATNAVSQAGTTTAGGGAGASIPSLGPATTARMAVVTNGSDLVVSNDRVRYTFGSYGGGLELVELTKYTQI